MPCRRTSAARSGLAAARRRRSSPGQEARAPHAPMPARRSRAPRFLVATLLAGLLVAPAPEARGADLDLSLSSHYSTGDYGGTDDIEIVYAPLVARFEHDAMMLKLIVPWLRISGGSTVVDGPGGPIVTPSGSEEGLGDIVLEGTWTFFPLAAWAPFVEVGGRLKIPTASSARGLGTGEVDLTPEVELSWSLGAWTPYLGVGFRVLGDPSEVVIRQNRPVVVRTTYRDGFLANAGLSRRFGDVVEPGAFVFWKESATAGGDDALEALPVLRLHLGHDWTLDAYASFGFTDSSPDHGAGLQLHYLFGPG